MCDTLCEGVTEGCCGGRGWAGGRTTRTHCEAPHWCVHPQVTEGWRGQPVRLEIRKKKGRVLGGPAGTVGEGKWLSGQ